MYMAGFEERIHYDPSTGLFTWKNKSRAFASRQAGTIDKDGYLKIHILGKRIFAHRLAWMYVHGIWPERQIDHINGIKLDNRIKNLREATPSQNVANSKRPFDNTSGYKGVTKVKYGKHHKWRAQIVANGRIRYLGWFDNPAVAHQAYMSAAKVHFGEFANSGG